MSPISSKKSCNEESIGDADSKNKLYTGYQDINPS